MGVIEHRLENGLTLMISEDHEEPRFSAHIGVRAGAADDPRDATGMAHYLEHMLANKGTTRLGTLDWAAERPHNDRIRALYDALVSTGDPARRSHTLAEIDRESTKASAHLVANELKATYGMLGARRLNAYTGVDKTVYVVDLPSNHLRKWAMLEGDRFQRPIFRSFQTEVETVCEEKNRSLDDPGRQLYQVMMAGLYGDHPYAESVLGRVEHLQNPSISKTEAYFRKWYVPNNMAIAIAGDVDPAEVIAQVEAHMGRLAPGDVPEPEVLVPAPLDAVQRLELVHRGSEEIRLVWRTVATTHADVPALSMADSLLDAGRTGLLNRRLNVPQIVQDSGASPRFMVRSGFQQIWARPRKGQSLDEVEALLLDAVAALAAGEFDDADMAAIVVQQGLSEKRALESNWSRVNRMIDAYTSRSPWDHARRFGDRLAAVSRAEVIRVARAWLGDGHLVVTKTVGEPNLPAIRAPQFGRRTLQQAGRSAFAATVLTQPTEETTPQVLCHGRDYTIEGGQGGKLYSAVNPYSDLAQLTWRWPTGFRVDPLLSSSLGAWKRSGVGDMSRSAFDDVLFRAGVRVDVSCRGWQTTASLTGPSEPLLEVAPLILKRLRHPELPGPVLEAHLASVVSRRNDQKTTAGLYQAALASYALYGADSTYLRSVSSPRLLELTVDEVRQRTATLLDLAADAFYAGPRVELPRLPGAGPSQPRPAQRYVQAEVDRVLFAHHASLQSDVRVYVPHEILNVEHLALVRLLREYLSGSAGLIFQEVREARGLAYSAGAGYAMGSFLGDQNYFWLRLATQADKTAAALGLVQALLRGRELDPDRFERALATCISKLQSERIPFRARPGTVFSWAAWGLSEDPRPQLRAALERLRIEDLRAYLASILDAPWTVAVVGNGDKIDQDSLGSDVQVLGLDDLLSW